MFFAKKVELIVLSFNMTHKTKGIVLKTIKYGETSLVVTVFTELFGVQTYMVNGVRTSKRGGSKAALFQPAAILDMEVYHNDLKAMQRIKESSWAVMYKNIMSEVLRNSIALYMVELLYRSLKQPEQNSDLFYFCEDAFILLDTSGNQVAANYPLYFSLHLSHFFGFKINEELPDSATNELFLDLIEGNFTGEQPVHPHFLTGENALITAELLKVMQVPELQQIKLSSAKRRELLWKYHDYYALHIQDFGTMKTLQVLHEVLA